MLSIGAVGAHAVTNAETKRSSAMASPRAISAAHEFEAQLREWRPSSESSTADDRTQSKLGVLRLAK